MNHALLRRRDLIKAVCAAGLVHALSALASALAGALPGLVKPSAGVFGLGSIAEPPAETTRIRIQELKA